MYILIPAYEPSEKLLLLIDQIKNRMNAAIVVVDDGSGEAYRSIFDKAETKGCIILRHPVNKGKGAALKTGFCWISRQSPDGVVCADCDGQHTCEDIQEIASAVIKYPHRIVLGVRQFVGKIPLRSRFGNKITRLVFSFVTGRSIHDTQTGLRGYPPAMLNWLCNIPGSRFDYEINILLEAQAAGYSFYEIPIQTIYENNNSCSHFRPIIDSIHVYLPLVKFSASSLSSFVLDFTLLLIFKALTNNLLISVLLSRPISATFNYLCNRHLVFKSSHGKLEPSANSALKYFPLALIIMLCNYGLLKFLTGLFGMPLVPAKLITETVLYLASFWIQKNYVFRTAKAKFKLVK